MCMPTCTEASFSLKRDMESFCSVARPSVSSGGGRYTKPKSVTVQELRESGSRYQKRTESGYSRWPGLEIFELMVGAVVVLTRRGFLLSQMSNASLQ